MMNKIYNSCWASAALIVIAGCAQYRIVADERNPSEGEISESVCGRFEPRENLQEVWFAGCHSDIGGYYVEGDLSYITLNWMVDLSVEQGLLVDRSLIPSMSAAYAVLPTIHNEKKGWGWLALDWVRGKKEFSRFIDAADYKHMTVDLFQSIGYDPVNLPDNMIVWNDVKRNGSTVIV